MHHANFFRKKERRTEETQLKDLPKCKQSNCATSRTVNYTLLHIVRSQDLKIKELDFILQKSIILQILKDLFITFAHLYLLLIILCVF